jgi:hypothetical protein
MSTPEKFALDLTAFAEKAKLNMDAVVRKVVLDIGRDVVMRSPVGNPDKWASPAPKGYVGGRFRANWQYGLNAKPEGVSGAIDKSGRTSISRIVAGLPKQAAGHTHYLTNNLPYAMRLETGWSKQAPGGLVGLAVRKFQEVVRKAAAEIKSGGKK